MYDFVHLLRNGIRCSRLPRYDGEKLTVLTKLNRDTAAALLKMAKVASDRRAAAAMVAKAADIKERLDGEAVPPAPSTPPDAVER